jgi:hypothetical protein
MQATWSLSSRLITPPWAKGGHILFNRLEPRSITSYLVLLLGFPSLLSVLVYNSYTNVFSSSLFVFATYLSSLIVSLLLYRVSPFHPLASYPGPLLCRVSRLWAWNIARQGKQHLYYHRLHERYGTHVRTGTTSQFPSSDFLTLISGRPKSFAHSRCNSSSSCVGTTRLPKRGS